MFKGYPEEFGCGLRWPQHYTDMNPCDFLLRVFLKDIVYRNQPHTTRRIGNATTAEIEIITPVIMQISYLIFAISLDIVYVQNLDHSENVFTS